MTSPAPAEPPAPTALPASPGPRNPLAWWGLGLSFGSVLAAVAGAGLALSVLGIVVARRTGRAMAPAVVGCVIAALALGAHAVLGTALAVGWVVSAVSGPDDGGSGGGSDGSGGADLTAQESDYLDALDASGTDTYVVYTDDALVVFGHQACDALDGGESPAQAAGDLDMGAAAAAEVVDVAAQVLCAGSGSAGGTGSA